MDEQTPSSVPVSTVPATAPQPTLSPQPAVAPQTAVPASPPTQSEADPNAANIIL